MVKIKYFFSFCMSSYILSNYQNSKVSKSNSFTSEKRDIFLSAILLNLKLTQQIAYVIFSIDFIFNIFLTRILTTPKNSSSFFWKDRTRKLSSKFFLETSQFTEIELNRSKKRVFQVKNRVIKKKFKKRRKKFSVLIEKRRKVFFSNKKADHEFIHQQALFALKK